MNSETQPKTIKSAKITITYVTSVDNGSNDFKSLQELKTWLDKHSDIADKLGYSKKK